MNKAITQIVRNHSTRIKDSRIFFSPDIPEKKLANTLSSYAKGAKKEDSLVLIDNTAFGNAKDGALLTTQALYAHNVMEKPKHIALGDIESVFFKKGMTGGAMHINGSKFLEINMSRKNAMQAFTDMLNEIARQLQSYRVNERTIHELNDNGLIINDEIESRKYSVQVTGKLIENMNDSDLNKRIAIIFKLSQDRVDELFQRLPVFVKKGLDLETAQKYKNTIEKAGVKCRIVIEKQTAITSPKLKKPLPPGSISRTKPDPSSLKQDPSLTPKIISNALKKIDERHFSTISSNVLKGKGHGFLSRALVDQARASCEIPSECEVIAVINKPQDSFIIAITAQGIHWNHRGICYFMSYADFRKIKIVARDPSDISIGTDDSIHISLKVNFEVIRDILVAFQYFVKNGRHIPEGQLLFKPQVCPRCGSVQWMATTKDSMNWKAGIAASILGGPLVGALTGSAMGKINKVKLCLSCHYVEKIDDQQGG